MARLEVIRPFVEKTVAEYLGAADLQVNEDGSIPVRRGSAAYYVRLMDGTPPMVQVYSTMLYDVKKSAKLLERLNEINSQVMFARAFWTAEQVVVATELVADSIDKDQIANACGVVSSVADHYDDELQGEFGGKVVFNEDANAAATAAEAPETGGETKPKDDQPVPGYM